MERRSVTEMSRRAALGVLAGAGGAFALFGPRGAKDDSSGRIVLDYWEKWTGHEGRAMERVVDEFNKSQNRITVRYLVTAGIDQKTLIAVAGGDPPDIVGLWNFNLPLYAEARAIIPLDEFGSRFGVKLENYATGMHQVMTHPDRDGRVRMWATVNTGGTLALYYNKSAFREVGLDPERPPRTIAELDEFSRKLDRVSGNGEISRAGFLHSEPGWWTWHWVYHFGGKLYDGSTDRALADAPLNIEAMNWLRSYSEKLGPEAVVKFRSGFQTAYSSRLNAFVDGKVAMEIQGPWLANIINTFNPSLDYGVAPFPVVDAAYDAAAPVGLIDTDILVIPHGARHPEASMEFIAYTQRPQIVEFLSNEHCKSSPLATSSEDFLSHHPNRGVRVHSAIAASPRSFRAPPTRAWPQFKDEVDASVQRVWKLESTVEDEMRQLQARAQSFLDHAADQRSRRGYSTSRVLT